MHTASFYGAGGETVSMARNEWTCVLQTNGRKERNIAKWRGVNEERKKKRNSLDADVSQNIECGKEQLPQTLASSSLPLPLSSSCKQIISVNGEKRLTIRIGQTGQEGEEPSNDVRMFSVEKSGEGDE